MPNTHGPIEPEFRKQMNALAHVIDEIVNGDKKGEDREVGFCLLMFRFGEPDDSSRMNYISNTQRKDMITAMEEFISREKRNT